MVTLLEIIASIGSMIAMAIYLYKDVNSNSGGG